MKWTSPKSASPTSLVAFAVLIALGAWRLGVAFNRLTQFERFARLATGVLFIAVVMYLSLISIFGVEMWLGAGNWDQIQP